MGARDCCATLWAIFIPPVAVFIISGCGCQLFLNIILTLCGFFPGEPPSRCMSPHPSAG
jgi:uncharacterized membrane protein YqaE (UPF0057 family)